MPNKHAAIKDLRKTKKRTAKNARIKMNVKALRHQFLALIKDGKKQDAQALVPKVQQAIAKASKTNVFHKNKSSRQVSALHRALATLK